MRQDATKRVRSAITSVMDAFGIPYQDVRRSNHPGIMFTVRGQTRTITYGGGDPRAHMNARTQARRVLMELGLAPNQQLLSDDRDAARKGSLSMDTIDSGQQTSPIEDAVRADLEDESGVKTSEPVNDIEQDQPDIEQDQPDIVESPDPISNNVPRFTDAGYVVFSPKKYHTTQVQLSQGRFLAVKLDRDLLAAKGSYLVIPFDIPDVVWDMPPHEFQSCFAPVQPDVAEVEPAVIQVYEDPPMAEPPPIRSSRRATPPPPPPPPDAFDNDDGEDEVQAPHYPHAVDPPAESKRGVSPQMGRVLLAMNFLHQQGEIEITGHAIQALLSPVDAKQVSGMLGGAIKLRYVARGSALDAGRGTRYKLAASGRKLAQSLGTWPYDHRGLAVPPWLRESMLMRA